MTLKVSKHCEFFFSGLYHDIMTPCQVSEILVIVIIFLIFFKRRSNTNLKYFSYTVHFFWEILGIIMFIWFFLCLCNFYRFFCNLIEVPTVQNCCTFWILLIFPEGINKLYYMFKFNKTLSWSNWSAAPLISLPKLKVAGSSLCGAHIFCTSKRVGPTCRRPAAEAHARSGAEGRRSRSWPVGKGLVGGLWGCGSAWWLCGYGWGWLQRAAWACWLGDFGTFGVWVRLWHIQGLGAGIVFIFLVLQNIFKKN